MGKISDALHKAAKQRLERLDKVVKIQEQRLNIVRKMKESKVDGRIVAYFDPKSLIAEQYKILTTNILSLNKAKPPRTIVISSSIANEGKTVTALNLAITMSHAVSKPKILLIDADMRKGKMIKYLGIEPHKGLSEYLTNKAQIEEIVFHIDIEHLSFISCGAVATHPAELLASERMKELLGNLRSQYDYILIDTPPVIPVTDAVIIGAQVDGVLMVISAGQTQRGMIHRAGELLDQGQAKVIGHVLTGVEYFVPDYIYRYL
jgi:capsular exopolysaccharide synthesis family protein